MLQLCLYLQPYQKTLTTPLIVCSQFLCSSSFCSLHFARSCSLSSPFLSPYLSSFRRSLRRLRTFSSALSILIILGLLFIGCAPLAIAKPVVNAVSATK